MAGPVVPIHGKTGLLRLLPASLNCTQTRTHIHMHSHAFNSSSTTQ